MFHSRRWTPILTLFELFADGKGLIVEDKPIAILQCRRHAGPDVQDIFSTLPDTGDAANYETPILPLNYFVPSVNTAFEQQSFHALSQKQGETVQQFMARL